MAESEFKVLTSKPGRVSLLSGDKDANDMLVFLMYRKLNNEISKESSKKDTAFRDEQRNE